MTQLNNQETLEDGEVRRVRVPLMMTDSAPTSASVVMTDAAVADRALDAYARFQRDRDAYLADRCVPAADGEKTINDAYEQSVRRLNDAHRQHSDPVQTAQAAPAPATVADAQAVIDRAYAESVRRMQEAWKTGG